MLGAISVVVILTMQFSLSNYVKSVAHQEFQPESAGHRILEVIANPIPANPFCWQLIQLEVNEDTGIYRGQSKMASAWPQVIQAASCPTIRVQEVSFDTNLKQFRDLNQTDCFFNAWLSYARAPILMGNQAFDLRFGDNPAENFTELKDVGGERACPPYLARWGKPRQDLLGE